MKRVLLAGLLLLGCGSDTTETPPNPPEVVLPGQSVSLASLVTSIAGASAVTWSVTPGGGSITSNGVYTAPSCEQLIAALPPNTDLVHSGQITGTDTVHAAWDGGSLDVNITIKEAVMVVRILPNSASVDPGGQTQFYAEIDYSCHTQTTQP